MRAALFALALLPSAALGERGLFSVRDACTHTVSFIATITITSPSASSYWFVASIVHCVASLTSLFLHFRVQNDSNTIDWTYTAGDPNPVDIVVTNGNNQTLNGDFSIARFVQVSELVRLARSLHVQRPDM